jgi:rod shape-determining protein MreC
MQPHKIAGRSGSFALFKRLKTRRIILDVAFYCAVIVVLHMKIGDYFLERCRFFANSAMVAINECGVRLERNFMNLCYFLSKDVDGVLVNLHNKNVELGEQVENLKSLRRENEELRKLLLLKESAVFCPIAAKVMNIFSSDFTQSILLNIGETDGASIDDVVRNSDGLIARIIETSDRHSRALLITDINSNIPVKIGDDQINAVATGRGGSDRLSISLPRDDVSIKEGDVVKTSGYGICENIPVGTIEKNNKKFAVKPFVNFNLLQYVIVLKKE